MRPERLCQQKKRRRQGCITVRRVPSLWDFDAMREFKTTDGRSARGGSFDVGGVAIAGGAVYVSSGYGLWGGTPGNVLLAFRIPRR
jgi:hypothetical protein